MARAFIGPPTPCSIEGCGNRAGYRSMGLCAMHQNRVRRTGNPGSPKRLWNVVDGPCAASGCGRKAIARNLCSTHWDRWRKHGDPERGNREEYLKFKRLGLCRIGGCDRSAKSGCKKMCWGHHRRFMKHGEEMSLAPVKKIAPQGTGVIGDKGYLLIRRAGRNVAYHRIVMEEHLGRQLLPDETVHHKNGQRLDNGIHNLELWSKSHPPGQRVSDKIAWAKALLALYEPGALGIEAKENSHAQSA